MGEKEYHSPKDVQERTFGRIQGGQDLIVVGPEKCGKSTTIVLSVVMRLKHAFEDVPRALILVSSKEEVDELVEMFEDFTKETDLRVKGVHSGGPIASQKDDLYIGVDVVVGTADRVFALGLKYGINLNGLQMFILDDADSIVKQGLQLPVREISEGLPKKCQYLVFTEVMHNRITRMVENFMNFPTKVEIGPEQTARKIKVVEHYLYRVPNFKTKQNLLNFFMNDDEMFTKVVVFVNTKQTADTLYKSLNKRLSGQIGMFNATIFDQVNFHDIEDFISDDEVRVLFIANEDGIEIDVEQAPFVFHFDLPQNHEIVLPRITKKDKNKDQIAITFSTDLELSLLKRLEVAIGKSIEEAELPPGVIVEGDRKRSLEVEQEDISKGGAFHEKKEKNAKEHNFNTKDKRKMHGKVRKNSSRKKGNK